MSPQMPKFFGLALYKGTRPGFFDGLANRLGRYLDRGPYSHVEMVFNDGLSASASFMDGGVRIRNIGYTSEGCWDFLVLPAHLETRACNWFGAHKGEPYDLMGNLRFATGFARDNPRAWFCSEACMAALDFSEPYRYGPSGMASLLCDVYDAHIIHIPQPKLEPLP